MTDVYFWLCFGISFGIFSATLYLLGMRVATVLAQRRRERRHVPPSDEVLREERDRAWGDWTWHE